MAMSLVINVDLEGRRRQVSKEAQKFLSCDAAPGFCFSPLTTGLVPRSCPVLHPPGHLPSQTDLLLHVPGLPIASGHRARVQRVGEHFVVAVIEGRGVGHEFGFATLNQYTRRVMLLADCQSYVRTLHRMRIHMPSPILVPGTALAAYLDVPSTESSIFLSYVQEEFPEVLVEPSARKCWNDGGGLELRSTTSSRASIAAKTANFNWCKYIEPQQPRAHPANVYPIVPMSEYMLLARHGPHELEVARGLGVDHHRAFDGDAADQRRVCGETRVQAVAGVLEERTNSRKGVVSSIAKGSRRTHITGLVRPEDLFEEVHEAPRALNDMDSDKLVASLAASATHLPSRPCTASCATRRSLRVLGAAGEAADWASCAASEGCREGAARVSKNGYWPGYDLSIRLLLNNLPHAAHPHEGASQPDVPFPPRAHGAILL
ncbi:hypothetical protein FIBSPDRAFT_930496 [Athelia psychrophila]|uniref:Uncharacterized protein n=1 Tax=Athelia psychrophila TaxID=1759441 RepID=A0A166LXB5_9AGAM|nr:hypothetical protein FIBSPDRAFT_930496 [Fibularhizoctonia sp. CBS 109695]